MHYCDYGTNIEREYKRHSVIRYPGRHAYPSKTDLEKDGLN